MKRPEIDAGNALWSILCLAVAALVYWIALEPLDPRDLKTIAGSVIESGEKPRRNLDCFRIRLNHIPELFDLCGTAYRAFERRTFEREVRKGDTLRMRVVARTSADQATGIPVYRVQDVRTPAGRVYLSLDRVQASRHREQRIGKLAMTGLIGGAVGFGLIAVRPVRRRQRT